LIFFFLLVTSSINDVLPREQSYSTTYNAYTTRPERLEFVHIPKAGGTVIEKVAGSGGLDWGMCHFMTSEEVSRMSMGIVNCPNNDDEQKSRWNGIDQFHGLVWWHLPPSYFFKYRDRLPSNPYERANLFAVVRDPYSRLVSEYYYQQTWLVSGTDRRKTQIVNYFNLWIKEKMEQFSHVYCDKAAKHDLFKKANSTKSYLSYDGHFIPQYDFIYDVTSRSSSESSSSSSSSSPKKMVKHVLKFENLHFEFDNLMSEYGLHHLIPLPKEHVRKSVDKKLGLYNLTLENLELIERIYKKDFEEFGYEIQSSKIPPEILERNAALSKCSTENFILPTVYDDDDESDDDDDDDDVNVSADSLNDDDVIVEFNVDDLSTEFLRI
jgi:hypothetical protein